MQFFLLPSIKNSILVFARDMESKKSTGRMYEIISNPFKQDYAFNLLRINVKEIIHAMFKCFLNDCTVN